jgi:hypothetical protein
MKEKLFAGSLPLINALKDIEAKRADILYL